MQKEIFADPQRRLTRAKSHIESFQIGMRQYLGEKPYARVVETEPDTGNLIHKIVCTAPIPVELFDLATEIIEGLRAVLDKCGYAAAEATGSPKLKGTAFPIAETEQKLQTDIIGRGRCRDLPQEILDVFLSFSPFKSGNFHIWALNQLANGSKHRVITPVGAATGNSFVGSFKCPGRCIYAAFPPYWDKDKNEMHLCTVAPNARPTYQMRVDMTIELGEPGLPGGPADFVFKKMADEVEAIMKATKKATAKLMEQEP